MITTVLVVFLMAGLNELYFAFSSTQVSVVHLIKEILKPKLVPPTET